MYTFVLNISVNIHTTKIWFKILYYTARDSISIIKIVTILVINIRVAISIIIIISTFCVNIDVKVLESESSLLLIRAWLHM